MSNLSCHNFCLPWVLQRRKMSSLQRSLYNLYTMITVRTHRVIFVLDLTTLTCLPHKCPTVDLKHDRREDVWEHDGMFISHPIIPAVNYLHIVLTACQSRTKLLYSLSRRAPLMLILLLRHVPSKSNKFMSLIRWKKDYMYIIDATCGDSWCAALIAERKSPKTQH